MGAPGVLATVLTCTIQLVIFGAPADFILDREKIAVESKQIGKITTDEIKVIVVLLFAVALGLVSAFGLFWWRILGIL